MQLDLKGKVIGRSLVIAQELQNKNALLCFLSDIYYLCTLINFVTGFLDFYISPPHHMQSSI